MRFDRFESDWQTREGREGMRRVGVFRKGDRKWRLGFWLGPEDLAKKGDALKAEAVQRIEAMRDIPPNHRITLKDGVVMDVEELPPV